MPVLFAMEKEEIGFHRIFVHFKELRKSLITDDETSVSQVSEKSDNLIRVVVEFARPLPEHFRKDDRFVPSDSFHCAFEHK